MNKKKIRCHILMWICLVTILLCFSSQTMANQSITQTFQLKTGWNSVFLELSPEDPNPDNIFTGTPVDQVVSYFPDNSPVQFIKDPEESDWKKPGWSRWVAPERPEALLKNLFELQADQAYLIFCKSDYVWTVSGIPGTGKQKWIPDAYNLTGFHVNPETPPTFAQYFEGSQAHSDMKIFFL